MKIESIKELKALIQLCKKTGVDHIVVGDVELWINEIAASALQYNTQATQQETVYVPGGITPELKIDPASELTEEQLLFYSVGDVSQ